MIIKIPAGPDNFAENKQEARRIRTEQILPALEKKEKIVLDFIGVRFVTQSFVHALIGEALTRFGEDVLDQIQFKNCNSQVRSIVALVVDYSFGGFEIYGKKKLT